jgi:ribosomal protein S18 acetylase RimI-like enzyme
MITYEPVTESQYTELLNLMLDHMTDYLETTMDLLGMSVNEFEQFMKTLGQVFSINCGNEVAGYYWIEERGQELHLHGIVLKEEYQRQGIGTSTLKILEKQYIGQKDFIELGVHFSNKSALKLYQGLGFEIETTKEDLKFHIMRKKL